MLSCLRGNRLWDLSFGIGTWAWCLGLLLLTAAQATVVVSVDKPPHDEQDLQNLTHRCVEQLVEAQLSQKKDADINIANIWQDRFSPTLKVDPQGQRAIVLFKHEIMAQQPSRVSGYLQPMPMSEFAVAELTPWQLSQLTSHVGLPRVFEAQRWQRMQDLKQDQRKYANEQLLSRQYHEPAWQHLKNRLDAIDLSGEVRNVLLLTLEQITTEATRDHVLRPILFLGSAEKVERTANRLLAV